MSGVHSSRRLQTFFGEWVIREPQLSPSPFPVHRKSPCHQVKSRRVPVRYRS